MSDTPKTDAVAMPFESVIAATEVVPAEFARQLERELRDCVCQGNWRLILRDTETLIGRWFRDHRGKHYRFFGLVHGEDDYYYGMYRPGSLRLLSCVGSIEGHGYTLVPNQP